MSEGDTPGSPQAPLVLEPRRKFLLGLPAFPLFLFFNETATDLNRLYMAGQTVSGSAGDCSAVCDPATPETLL